MPYQSSNGDVTIALTGDAMITRALKPFSEPNFLGLRDLLVSADVRITNGEMLFHNYENWPASISATWMRCDPRILHDLKWFGINMVSCANNHGMDYGENGVLTNLDSYEEAGLVHAGSGRTYAEAVAPAYLDTPQGRVALVAGTTSARPNARAGEQRRDLNGRPGVNLLRWVNEWCVDELAFEQLSRVASEFGWRKRPPSWWKESYRFDDVSPDGLVFFADRNSFGVGSEDPVARFVASDHFEHHSVIHRADLKRNVQSIDEARRMADWVVYSIHNHEGGSSRSEPSEHVQSLAHAVIDAGADVVFGHGPHLDRGIEIYRGKPIFYSIGTFLMQNDTVERLPHEAMVQWGFGHENSAADLYDSRLLSKGDQANSASPHAFSFVAKVSFHKGELSDVSLHPIEFGFGVPRSQAGRPMIAERSTAAMVLSRMQELSDPLGTKLDIDGAVGKIAIA